MVNEDTVRVGRERYGFLFLISFIFWTGRGEGVDMAKFGGC